MSPRDQVEAAIVRVRDQATAQYGWSHVELSATAMPAGGVEVRGTVAVHGLIARLRDVCGPDVVLDVANIRVLASDRFFAVPDPGITLMRRPDRERDDELVTELDARDGPVECLAQLAGGPSLVRARDGTVGWTTAPLVSLAPRPRLSPPAAVDTEAIVGGWARWIGSPYRLGGTRRGGIDCSALVQRLLDPAGLRVPRHSTDQLAIGAQPGSARDVGTIVAIWSDHEAPCHVGLAVGDARIVHASRSRACVVVEDDTAFVAGARRVAHVSPQSLLALQHRAAGDNDLLAALRV